MFVVTNREDYVVVRNEDGERTARLPLPESGKFELQYRHSYYRAPAAEHFIVEDQGFRLVSISSTNGGVLDYYALEGERRERGDRMLLDLDKERGYKSMPLIATQEGRRTLVADGEKLPLYTQGEARHLTIDVEPGLPRRVLSAIPGYTES